jgi:hypothetical protein
MPTLVLINGSDPMHPAGYGERLAAGIPGASLVEIASKERDPVCTLWPGKPSGFVSSLADR